MMGIVGSCFKRRLQASFSYVQKWHHLSLTGSGHSGSDLTTVRSGFQALKSLLVTHYQWLIVVKM